MNFQHYLFLFLRYSWLIILIMAAMLAATWVWMTQATPIYASRAVLQVETEQARVVNIEDVKENKITGLDAVNTVVQTLSSNTILLAVARETGHAEEWAKEDPSGKLTPSMESALAEAMRRKIKVSLRRATRLIDIVASEKDPEKARQLAMEVVDQFLALQNQDRSDVSKDANSFLVNEATKLKAKLEESEQKLAQYRLQNKAVSVDDRQNIVVQRLGTLNNEVTQANAQRAMVESDLAALREIKPSDVEGMLKLRSVAALPNVALLRTAVLEKEAEFARVKERYLEKHPKYGAAKAELGELKGKLATAVASAGDTLRQQYASFKETEQKLKDMLTEQEAKALELDQIAIPYKALEREAQTDRNLYETILTRLKETDVTQGLTKTPYRLIEEPIIDPEPVFPRKLKFMVIAGFLSLMMGAGLVLLLDRLDSSIRTVDDAERELGYPVLAAVPEADLSKVPQGGTCMTDDSNSGPAEAFRTLRASLSLLGEEDQRRLILVTSAIPSEGKTFSSINLAAAFATQGLRTLLIDADLRRPALSATLLSRDDRKAESFRGLTDVLSNLCTQEEAIRPTAISHLSLLPSGRRAPNPAELLSQPSVAKLLEDFVANYDRVVIDSAPVNAVSDSLRLAPQAHAVCLVLRYGKTPRRAIQRALTLLKKSGARMAGLVMNRMPTSRSASYYYYYYGEAYAEDSPYGADEKKDKKKRKKASAEV
jgi:succinoglycan biosynthesis transport protein ExoP